MASIGYRQAPGQSTKDLELRQLLFLTIKVLWLLNTAHYSRIHSRNTKLTTMAQVCVFNIQRGGEGWR